MKKLYVQDVLKKVKGEILCGDANKEIEGVSIDTRTIQKGDTYFGLRGENVDGSIYCKDAIKKGAKICFIQTNIFTKEELLQYKNKITIVLVENVEDTLVETAKIKRSFYNIPVIGITGSVGKTSTKDVIAEVMSQKFNVQKTSGNQNNRLGVPLTILSLKDHEALVIEMGMNHFGEIRELTQIAKPTLCVISNIGTSHIGNLGSRENILKAKLEILEGMKNGKVIINNDNDLLHKWNLEDKENEKITFGIKEKSDYKATNIKMKENENEFEIELNGKKYTCKTEKPGEPFILNALSAIAVGNEFEIPMEKMQKAISSPSLSKNRMEIEKVKDILLIKDYYNASYESIKPSLEYLASLKEGKKIAVLGDIKEVGEFSQELHEKVGKEVANNKIDKLITVGIEARYIAESAILNGMPKENVFMYKTNLQATKKLKQIANNGDKVLLKASNSMKFGEIYEGFSSKIKVAIIIGGKSSEHDVSIMSGKSIIEKINKDKYEITVIMISQNGKYYEYTGKIEEIDQMKQSDFILRRTLTEAISNQDVVFPVLHGRYGEDGCIQGTLETIQKAYVGCGVLSSAVCMDKEFTKKIVAIAGIPVAKSLTIHKRKTHYIIGTNIEEKTLSQIEKQAEKELGYPMFIKPSSEGSSFGVSRATNKDEFKQAIKEAEKYDDKILIEEEIIGREVECAVLGNNEVISSEVGEIKAAEKFYTYDAKYNNPQSQTIIPADLKPEERRMIKQLAEKAFIAVEGKGISRVDFFLKDNGEIILNEINTMPGFTKISMYPKLFEAAGIEYTNLIDKLIELAIER